MNCLPVEATIELGALWKWYDAESELRCAVFTGAGEKAFCAGMDLKQRLDIINTNDVAFEYPQGGFGGCSNRTGKKPIVVAVNGHAHGRLFSTFPHIPSMHTHVIIQKTVFEKGQLMMCD
jgi:enoyl-CoA hydratase/carnithine racemase